MSLRIVIAGAITMALIIWAGACAGRPAPACPVAVGNPLGFPAPGSPLSFSRVQPGLPSFWASYQLESGTGACAQLAGEEVGFQRFETPNEPTQTTLAIRPFTLGYLQGSPNGFGAMDSADFDPSNDVDEAGHPDPAHPVPDPVFRVDPDDPAGLKINAVGKLAAKPAADNTCAVTDLTVSEQRFRQEVLRLVPGGTASARGMIDADAGIVTFPALDMRYEWSELKLVSTGDVPGSLFTAKLKYTESGCTAAYAVTGIWPMTLCHTDLDCSPEPLPEAADGDIAIPARKLHGSGLNPAFEDAKHLLKCNNSPAVHAYVARYALSDSEKKPVYGITDWGICEMTRPVSDFTSAP